MKLASYHGTRSGLAGLGNILIRLRLRGRMSHSEIVFEPGDGVDDLVPDGTCEPDADGALWCASAVGAERLPVWSRRRSGSVGGVRFKRVVLSPEKWALRDVKACARKAAEWARANEGTPYDWSLILGYIAWFVPNGTGEVLCSEACAEMLGIPDAWRFDPCSLDAAVLGLQGG